MAALLKSIELGAYADAFLATPITGADLKLMEEASFMIKRDVIFAASLYVV